jgi:hypothetical protein
MELNTIILSDFVKLAKVIWKDSYDSVEQSMLNSGLVKKVNIPMNTGNTREFSSVDSNEYLTYKGESDQAARGRVQQGYTNTMTMYRVAENIGISHEMRTQNKYPEVVARITNAARKGANTIDLDLSHRFTNGTSTSYTDRDGRTIDVTTGASATQQLFDTDHPLKGSSTTYRNRLANNPRLSKGAIEGMERLITENTYNNLGEKVTAKFDILWTTDDPNAVNTAREYLKSTADIGAAHSGVINVYQGKYKHVILPRVNTDSSGAPSTKRDYWGIASSSMSSFYCGIWEAPHLIPPAANDNSEDVQTDDWDFRARCSLGITIVDAAWVKFSSGDGVA